METLIIQVDCRPFMREGIGPPQLGITVEDPSFQQRKQLKAAAKDYFRHDYHNLDDIQISSSENRVKRGLIGGIQNNANGSSTKYSTQLAATLGKGSSKYLINNYLNDKPIQDGLQITQIQEGSVIDRIGQFKVGDIIVEVNGVNLQRPFTEAQKTLKQFVIEHTSHGPLVLKVLRKSSSSSSSIPSTTGSQITVIENVNKERQSLKVQQKTEPKLNAKQQVKNLLPITQTTPIKSIDQTSPKTPSTSSRHLVGALNTRRIGTRYIIRLKKGLNGFGIKIAERDNMHNTKNRPIYITAITTIGSAYQDGQLKEGDMLLEVNGVDLQGRSQPEVTKMLKSVGINEEVELVISRQELVPDDTDNHPSELENSDSNRDETNDDSLIDLSAPEQDDSVFVDNSNNDFEKRIDSILNNQLVDGPGKYVYDIPLNDTKSAGLGLYLKYPRRSSDRKDLGIWIEKVITGGAAWKDGRLQPNDQILAINGISLIGLSNSEASETLTAAVCRGIGPEATPNTIRLNIQRRDPSVTAKVLLGTDNRIEHSDVIKSVSHPNFERNENSSESYQTAFDVTMQNRSTQSNINVSSGSSNQNSQNDSAMSPQTQASSSSKLSASIDKQNSSDKTNETTSSAISQITDFTNVPISDSATTERCHNGKTTCTIPKTLESETQQLPNNTEDNASSGQSWDDESLDVVKTGEEAFQRDGFGRQSISEKRHAQLNAKNTDTFKRNQKAREERERQRKLEEQMARHHLDGSDGRQGQPVVFKSTQYVPSSYTTGEFKSIYGLQTGVDIVMNRSENTYHREVPVDVQMPTMNKMFIDQAQPNRQIQCDEPVPVNFKDERTRIMGQNSVPNLYHHETPAISSRNMIQANRCLKCGGYESSCLCESLSQQQHVAAMRSAYQIYGGINNPGFDHSILKRSNSLESVQQHTIHNDLIVARAGTVRVARNRKVNESFRAAVDRSYEGSTNESSSRNEHSEVSSDHRNIGMGPYRITSSIANSTISTSNDEKYLIKNQKSSSGNHTGQKKSSSLLTKFLKFGSMKKKKKNRDLQSNDTKDLSDPKSNKISNSSQFNKDQEQANRSQSSKGCHSRNQSSQSHPNIVSNHQRQSSQMSKHMDSQMFVTNMKQPTVLPNNNMHNGFDIHHQHRMSLPMCQYQQSMLPNNLNTQLHHNQIQPMASQPKQHYQFNSLTLNRPMGGPHSNTNHQIHHHQQYSQVPIHHQNASLLPSPLSSQQHPNYDQVTMTNHQHIRPIEPMPNHHMLHLQSLGPRDSRQSINPPIMQNGCSIGSDISNQWQSPPHPAPNGLWVTNSPSSENMQPPPPIQNIYGTLPQQQTSTRLPQVNLENNYTISHNHQPRTMMQPFIPQIAGPPPQLHPTHQMNDQMHNSSHYGATRGHNNNQHNMQPQHIYYYDF